MIFIDVEGNVQGERNDIDSHASGAVVQTAIVAVKAHVKVLLDGNPTEAPCRYLRVWLFQENRWQILSAVYVFSLKGRHS